MRHKENKKQSRRCNSKHINNIIKCKWIKQSDQKAELVKLDNKPSRSIYIWFTGDTL